MIDLTINKTGLEHNIQKAKENHIIIPTIAQMQNPDLIPEKIKAKLSHTGLWDVDPVNLFRISWHNEAKEQGGLYVRQDGRQFRAREPASRLYLEVSAAGMGKRQNSAPKSVPDAELEFGNGCILRFWGLDVWDGYNRQWVPGVFVWYRGANGKIYMYDTDRMQWQTLVRCLPEE